MNPRPAVKPFFRVVTPAEARTVLDGVLSVGTERVPVADAAGRVVAAAVVTPGELPTFHRAHMDGYAVRARDTFGASPSIPAYLRLAGVVEMGKAPPGDVARGCAMRIATGGMLPDGADAVVMVEHTEEVAGGQVEIARPVAPWENVLRRGEDVGAGVRVVEPGVRLRPHDLGALTGAGILEIEAFRRPRLALIGTGDEIVDPAQVPGPGQVRNINQISLKAMACSAGAAVLDLGVCPDDPTLFAAALAQGLEHADAIFVSGGSSVGTKDMTLDVIARLPGAEIAFHGISVAPGKPTLLAWVDGAAGGGAGRRPVVGLPGHPVSALVICDVFGVPLLRRLGGERSETAWRARERVAARLTRNIDSAPGREDYVRVRLVRSREGFSAEPLPGKSGAVFSLLQADGYVVVEMAREGIEVGEEVAVALF